MSPGLSRFWGRSVLCCRTDMQRILRRTLSIVCLALALTLVVLASARLLAQQPAAAQAAASRPKVLAFFTSGGELDHYLFAQQAMRAFAARAGEGGYAFSATSDWD